METLTKTTKRILRILGILGRLPLILFSSIFAALALVAFTGIFHESVVFSLVGCIGCAAAAWILWHAKDDIPVSIE